VRLRKAHNAVFERVDAARRAPPGKRDEYVRKVRQALGVYFDLKQESIAREIRNLDTELQHLKKVYAKRKEKRERMIERRLRDLFEDDEEPEW
jgi:hypothetical protein